MPFILNCSYAQLTRVIGCYEISLIMHCVTLPRRPNPLKRSHPSELTTKPCPQGAFPTPPAPVSPREDFARLLRDAAEGLPVAGRVPTWEADRPKTLPVGEPIKVRTTKGDLATQCVAWGTAACRCPSHRIRRSTMPGVVSGPPHDLQSVHAERLLFR